MRVLLALVAVLAYGLSQRSSRSAASGQPTIADIAKNPAAYEGKPVTVTFYYDGRLSGQEDSPVYGIKFAAIQNDYVRSWAKQRGWDQACD